MNRVIAVMIVVFAVPVSCRKAEEPPPPKLEISKEKSVAEEQNLKSLCKAATEVAKVEGIQDRMARISEIAAPVSTSTELLDGLTALEGQERLPAIKKLVAKYGLEKECADTFRMFEKAAPRPKDPGPPKEQDPNRKPDPNQKPDPNRKPGEDPTPDPNRKPPAAQPPQPSK